MAPAAEISVNGYILAGGKSSRMDTDKELLYFNGKPIIQRVIEQLHPAVDKIVIVSDNPGYERFGYEVIHDLIKEIGRAAGIYSALSHAVCRKIFIVSCDMPFISANAISYIIQYTAQSEITLPLYQEKTEPLFGVYSKECLVRWQELIGLGIIKLQDMVNHFNLLRLNVGGNNCLRISCL